MESIETYRCEDFSNLEHLNGLLQKYIKIVQALEEKQGGSVSVPTKNTIINVNIDRSKFESLTEEHERELEILRETWGESNDEGSRLLGRMTQLEAEIKILKKNNTDKDWAIQDRDLNTIKLKSELNRLQANLNLAQSQKEIFYTQIKVLREDIGKMIADLETVIKAYADEKVNNAMLAGKIQLLEMELRFRLSILSSSAETEDFVRNLDMSSIEDEIEDHYQQRLTNQVDLLRKMYSQQLEASTTALESVYMDKIVQLKNEITALPKHPEVSEQLEKLKIELESCRLKHAELETNNVDLANKQAMIQAIFNEKKRIFHEKETAKQKELLILQQENEAIKMKYQNLMNNINMKQVKDYSSMLIPEVARYKNYFGSTACMSNRKTLNFSNSSSNTLVVKKLKKVIPSSSGSSSSSSSDSEEE